ADLARECGERVPRPTASAPIDWGASGSRGEALARVAESALGRPPLPGNRLELKENADATFPALIEDIDPAGHSCDRAFYTWSVGGRADEVAGALIRAAGRGVSCRVLVDAIGSAAFLRSGLAGELRQSGVQVQGALPSGLSRLLFVRADLRLHRKIAVFDGRVGYTGSLNLADPLYFKKEAGVGPSV